jgi:hypothetical protein
MTFEAVGLRIGVLQSDELQLVPDGLEVVRVVVIAADGPPFVGEVEIGLKKAGPARHRTWKCPTCKTQVYKLFLHQGRLTCGTCGQRRTRRQQEKNMWNWSRGGEIEARLLRDVQAARGGQLPQYLFTLRDKLLRMDDENWRALKKKVEDAIVVGSLPRRVDVADVEEELA